MRHHNNHHHHYLHCDAPPSPNSLPMNATDRSPLATHSQKDAVVASSPSHSVVGTELKMLHSTTSTTTSVNHKLVASLDQRQTSGSQVSHEHTTTASKLKRCLTNTSSSVQSKLLNAADQINYEKREQVKEVNDRHKLPMHHQHHQSTTIKRYCKQRSPITVTTNLKDNSSSQTPKDIHHHSINSDISHSCALNTDRSTPDSDADLSSDHTSRDTQPDRLNISTKEDTFSSDSAMTASIKLTRLPPQTVDTITNDSLDTDYHHHPQTFHERQDDDEEEQLEVASENDSHQFHRQQINPINFATSDRCHEACVAKLTQAQLDTLGTLFKIIKNGDYEEFSEMLGRKCFKSLLNVFIDGQTALHYSLLYGRNLAWCKELIRNGANPNLTNRAGWHPIHLAAFNGSRETMRYLIERIAS